MSARHRGMPRFGVPVARSPPAQSCEQSLISGHVYIYWSEPGAASSPASGRRCLRVRVRDREARHARGH
jgi:hypothetical protein